MRKKQLQHLSLGSSPKIPRDYDPKLLECFSCPPSESWVSFIATEFTALCPKTGQPDFAKIFINYIPNNLMLESRSLKLYLFSFRNHGSFHEECVESICNDIKKLIKPKYLEVIGQFTPRGGISIFSFSSISNNEKKYKELRKGRILNYAPGKYTMTLDKLY